MLDSIAKEPMLDSVAKDPMLDWAAYQDVRMDTWPVTSQKQGYASTPSRFSPSTWVLLKLLPSTPSSLHKFPVGGRGVVRQIFMLSTAQRG